MQRDVFLSHLNEALRHLYVNSQLRKSPLIAYFGLSGQFDAPSHLRKVLVDGIESLKPPDHTTMRARAWKAYETLNYSFIQGLSQEAVADQLNISTRQLFREKAIAIDALADVLWIWLGPQPGFTDQRAELGNMGILEEEFPWKRNAGVDHVCFLASSLSSSLEVLEPVIQNNQVSVTIEIPNELPPLAIHPTILNHILITVFSVAVKAAAGGKVLTVSAEVADQKVFLSIRSGQQGISKMNISDEDQMNIAIVQELAEKSSSRLTIQETDGYPFEVIISILTQEIISILVVDDNPDMLNLFQRYATGTRYKVVTTRDSEQVVPLCEEHHVRMIIIDILMPDVDGWTVLGRIRHHPRTNQIPVVVCSVLPQESLALTIGAKDFLKKPVTRQAFLDTINRNLVLTDSRQC